jgi:hypothetical protein
MAQFSSPEVVEVIGECTPEEPVKTKWLWSRSVKLVIGEEL